MIWHDIRDPKTRSSMNWRGKYNLHPLHIEDCRNRNQSAKVEPMNDYLFIVLKPVDMTRSTTSEHRGSRFLHRTGLDHHGPGRQVCRMSTEALNKVRSGGAKLRSDEIFYRVMDVDRGCISADDRPGKRPYR